MKKTILIFLVILLILTVCSCNNSQTEENSNYIDWSKYYLVMNKTGNEDWASQYTNIKNKYYEIVGKYPEIRYIGSDEEEYEIYFPTCSVSMEMAESYKPSDYSIVFEGNKIYIVAGASAIQSVFDRFINEVLTEKADFKSGDTISYNYQYRFSSFTINNIDISEYIIFYNGNESQCLTLAMNLNMDIGKYTGIEIQYLDSSKYSAAQNSCAILLGDCGGISQGITENVKFNECIYRCEDTTIAIYPYSYSLILFYDFIDTYIAAQLESTPLNNEGKIILEDISEGKTEGQLKSNYTAEADTSVVIYNATDSVKATSLRYYNYREKQSWIISQYPDIIILPSNISTVHDFQYDNAGIWYDIFGKATVARGTQFNITILSKKGRYKYTAGQYYDDYSWEVLYDNYYAKNILVVAVHLTDDYSNIPLQIEKIMKKIDEQKAKYGESTPVIIGVSGGICSSDPALDILELNYFESAYNASLSSDGNKASRRTLFQASTDNEPKDMIYVSKNIDILLHKISDFNDESALPVFVEIDIQ